MGKQGVSAVSDKEIKKIVNSFNKDNCQFIIEIYKYLRHISEDKLKNNIIFYEQKNFANLGRKDKSIARLVTRYDDIMLCLDVYNKYDKNLLAKNMVVFGEVIRRVALDVDLDRVIYVRLFKKGHLESGLGVIKAKGYQDKYREFNEDILDLLTISLEEVSNNKQKDIVNIMRYWN